MLVLCDDQFEYLRLRVKIVNVIFSAHERKGLREMIAISRQEPWQVVKAGPVVSKSFQTPFCHNSFFTHAVGKCLSGDLGDQGNYLF